MRLCSGRSPWLIWSDRQSVGTRREAFISLQSPMSVPFGQRGLALSGLDVSVNWAWILGLLVARGISEQTSLPSSWAPGKSRTKAQKCSILLSQRSCLRCYNISDLKVYRDMQPGIKVGRRLRNPFG